MSEICPPLNSIDYRTPFHGRSRFTGISKFEIDGGALARPTISTERHGWMTVRKRFVGRWHKVQCPPVKCTTHDALTESIGKSVNLLSSYTEHKRNIRARGNRTGKIDFFRPFLRFPHTHTVDAI